MKTEVLTNWSYQIEADGMNHQLLKYCEDIYNQHAKFLKNYLFRLESSGVHEDFLQEAFIQFYKLGTKAYEIENPKAWLVKVSVRKFLDYKRLKFLSFKSINDEKEVYIEGRSEFSEEYKAILIAIQNISPKQRSVFVLYFLEEWTMDEIAKSLKISVGTVKSRISVSRKRVQEELLEKGISL